ncbi:MAG: DUF4294 domain-containing protein [Rikenellaceae bacterium]
MKPLHTIHLLLMTLSTLCVSARSTRSSSKSSAYTKQEWTIENGERIANIHLTPVRCRARGVDMRRYARLVLAVKKTYPIAKIAREKMSSMEQELVSLPTKSAQREYIKQVYKELIEEYTPVLRSMTRTQGRILVRLIDRETEFTAYDIVRDFRGTFVASFWQGIGRIFGQDLKSEYGSTDEDKIIEQIILHYEAGVL